MYFDKANHYLAIDMPRKKIRQLDGFFLFS
jgi:hypothetical protein